MDGVARNPQAPGLKRALSTDVCSSMARASDRLLGTGWRTRQGVQGAKQCVPLLALPP